jgi:hypothetical protein
MTGIQRVNVGQRSIGTQQIAERAALKPLPMQSPFGSRREQPIRHQHPQHLIEARAFARRRQPRAPEFVEPKLLPQLQRQPTAAPLPRPLEPQLPQLQAHDRLVRHYPLATVFGKQRQRACRSCSLVQHLDRAAPGELL